MRHNALHHVTAIAGPARRNLDFYTRTLGLRLVKKTVNFDDPSTYHFYFADAAAQPGTVLTFFPWEHAAPGRIGVGQTQETSFRIPESAIGYWSHRLLAHGVAHEAPTKRVGETAISFTDPDGMRFALVAVPGIEGEAAWTTDDIPADVAIRGFHGVNLLLADATKTAAILTGVFGFVETATEGSVTRYQIADRPLGGIIDLHEAGGFLAGREGAGSVHHIAFRADDDADQAAMVKLLTEAYGQRVTGQRDRDYFRSVYFREPGGVLFEIATDAPGFAVDEPADSLGQALKLPKQYEPQRAAIEAKLPKLV